MISCINTVTVDKDMYVFYEARNMYFKEKLNFSH